MKNEQSSRVALRDIGNDNPKNQWYISEWLCNVCSVQLATIENRRLNRQIINEYKKLIKEIKKE